MKQEHIDQVAAAVSAVAERLEKGEVKNIFADSELIGTGDLDLRSSLQRKTAPSLVPDVEALSLRDMERNAIIRALQRWEGNRTRAADELGISRRTLINKIQEYGIGKDS